MFRICWKSWQYPRVERTSALPRAVAEFRRNVYARDFPNLVVWLEPAEPDS